MELKVLDRQTVFPGIMVIQLDINLVGIVG